MGIAELIEELQKIKEKEGNLPVYILGTDISREQEIDKSCVYVLNKKYYLKNFSSREEDKNRLKYPKRVAICP